MVHKSQPDNEVEGTSGAFCSSIYPIRFGQTAGVMGLEHGGIDIEEIGEIEPKDTTRHWIKHYAMVAHADFLLGQVSELFKKMTKSA